MGRGPEIREGRNLAGAARQGKRRGGAALLYFFVTSSSVAKFTVP